MQSRIRQPLSVLAFLALLIALGTCSQPEVVEQPTKPILTSNVYEEVDCAKNPTACTKIRGQIGAYKDFVNSYLEPGDGVKVDSITVNGSKVSLVDLVQEMTLLQGYQFNLSEVSWIVDQAGTNKVDHVYTLFAINNDPSSVAYRKKIGSPILYLDLYFEVDTKGAGALFYSPKNGLELDDYGDFPKPCPRACPD